MPGFASTLAPVVEHIAQLLGSRQSLRHVPALHPDPMRSTRQLLGGGLAPGLRRSRHAGCRRAWDHGLGPRKKRRQKPPAALEAGPAAPHLQGVRGGLSPRARSAPSAWCLLSRVPGQPTQGGGGGLSQRNRHAHMAEFERETGIRSTHTRPRRRLAGRWPTSDSSGTRRHGNRSTGEQHDPEWFKSEILPGLAAVTLSRIAEATGMSVSAASKIRAGRRIPHPRHWVLHQLVERRN